MNEQVSAQPGVERLAGEISRLFLLPGQTGPGVEGASFSPPEVALGKMLAQSLAGRGIFHFDPGVDSGITRVQALSVGRAAGWKVLEDCLGGLREDLDLPMPVVSVSGRDAWIIWFSMAGPTATKSVRALAEGIRRRYFGSIPEGSLRILPEEGGALELSPARNPDTGRWSAFIDPSMGGMFADEPWLEMVPNPERQADLLAGFVSIEAAELEKALRVLGADAGATEALEQRWAHRGGPSSGGVEGAADGGRLVLEGPFPDPRSFLMAVMNDSRASAAIRVEAAKALLPWFEGSHRAD